MATTIGILSTHTHTHTRRAPLLKSRPAAFRPFVDAPSLFRLFLTFAGAEEQQQQQQEGKKNRKNGQSHRQKSLRTCCRRRRRRRRPSAVGRPSSDGRRRRPWLRFQPKQNGGLKISIKKKKKEKERRKGFDERLKKKPNHSRSDRVRRRYARGGVGVGVVRRRTRWPTLWSAIDRGFGAEFDRVSSLLPSFWPLTGFHRSALHISCPR